ncbi:MAG: O-antigen ligase family protein [Cyanobacteria bacterium]|nr:O-antigen ligase family protein [Cyanobacteriota bacterium]
MTTLEHLPTGKPHSPGLMGEFAFLLCLGILPYVMVASLGGVVVLTGICLAQSPRDIFKRLYQVGFAWLTVLLIVSTLQATYVGEASLQLLNFLPYFLVWSAISGRLLAHKYPWRLMERWAWILVLGAIPAFLGAGAEYGLKRLDPVAFPSLLVALPPLDWLYTGVASDPRAYGPFDSPNTLANYAVMVLGLALGLLMMTLERSSRRSPRPAASASGRLAQSPAFRIAALGLSVASLLLALYCSGSRNGYLIALLLFLSSAFLFKVQRWIRWLGFGLVGAIIASVLTFGIGDRPVSGAWVTQDPRVYVWRLALRHFHASPWWGKGLGSYKLLYDGSVPGYTEIPHAHNLWLSLAAESGILTTLCLTIAIGLICYRVIRQWQQVQGVSADLSLVKGYSLTFFAVVLFSLFDVTLYDGRINLLAWLSLAVLYGFGQGLGDCRVSSRYDPDDEKIPL